MAGAASVLSHYGRLVLHLGTVGDALPPGQDRGTELLPRLEPCPPKETRVGRAIASVQGCVPAMALPWAQPRLPRRHAQTGSAVSTAAGLELAPRVSRFMVSLGVPGCAAMVRPLVPSAMWASVMPQRCAVTHHAELSLVCGPGALAGGRASGDFPGPLAGVDSAILVSGACGPWRRTILLASVHCWPAAWCGCWLEHSDASAHVSDVAGLGRSAGQISGGAQ